MTGKEESLTSLRRRARAYNRTARETCTKQKKQLKDLLKGEVDEFRTNQKKDLAEFVAGKASVAFGLHGLCRGGSTMINMKQKENGLRRDLDLIKKRNAR
jgi:hypothetical protein